MRKVTVFMSMSLDGFIEGPGHDLDWHQVDEEVHRHFNDQLEAAGAFINGRVMYELMAAFWPTADTDPASTPQMARFARIWREKPKIVYSRTLRRADWNATVRPAVDPAEVEALKAEPGGDLTLGGAELAAEFMRFDLVDEYRVYVHPVLVGGGKRLFGAADGIRTLRLMESHTFGNGVVLLHYRR
ncbi:Dihydrofolate reductase [Streptomyces sp. DvalAA-14]|uniref:dihydrofolate reductase family protein n=1 Tax=unclassified Streptomyces TaxID=2593676 RepID=UPI00081AFE1F|nr:MULTISPECIES: dihydrofolate reductase family protein [unclassified Streptomyces]MYS20145.1 dihydrofolate reductase [Streptomyces sp. SID4948]SCD61974.1 Dihydrofolate reductase [Streptomyces sp. DvalAA-14]